MTREADPVAKAALSEAYCLMLDPAEERSEYETGRSKRWRLLIRVVYCYGECGVEEDVVNNPLIIICTAPVAMSVCALYLLSQVVKVYAGRLRPNFLDVCRPSLDLQRCRHAPIFITNYSCTGEWRAVEESRYSFFSQHACLSFAASVHVFVSAPCTCSPPLKLCLGSRLRGKLPLLAVLPLLQALIIAAAVCISYSRIVDNKHHPSDVLVGAVIGIAAGLLTVTQNTRIGLRQLLP